MDTSTIASGPVFGSKPGRHILTLVEAPAHRRAARLRARGRRRHRDRARRRDRGRRPGDLTFFANPKYAAELRATRASAVILGRARRAAPCAMLRTREPYVAFAPRRRALRRPLASRRRACTRARMSPTARTIAPDASIGAARRDRRARADRRPYHRSSQRHDRPRRRDRRRLRHPRRRLDSRARPHSATASSSRTARSSAATASASRAATDGTHEKIPQIGGRGDRRRRRDRRRTARSIGRRSARRASAPAPRSTTSSRSRTASSIGQRVLLAAQVGIAGSSVIEDDVTLAGQVGVSGHITIGKGTIATAQTGIPNSVEPGSFISGYPAIPNRDWLKSSAVFRKLPAAAKALADLERRLEQARGERGMRPPCHNRDSMTSHHPAAGRAGCRGAGALRHRSRRDGRGASAEARLHDDDAAERAAGRLPRRPLDADRARRDLVPRRIEERARGPDRLRASLRAHDVQGLEERRAGRAPVVDLERRRPEQRLHERRRDGLLADVPGAVPAARAVARGGSHGLAAHRRGGLQDRARGREGRAADARREPAVRPAERDHLRPGVHRASVQAPDDRQHEGSRGGVGGRRPGLFQDLLRAEQRDARARRRLRHEGSDGARRAVPRPRPEGDRAGAARHSEGAAADEGAPRAARGEPGRCRRSSSRTTSRSTATRTRIRCTSRRRCCPTARARGSTRSWSTRSRSRSRRSAAATSSRIRTCSSPWRSCSPATRRRRRRRR